MKIIKIIITILLSLLLAVLILWGILHYLVWPAPELSELVPGKPLVYFAASDLDKTVLAIQESDFLERFLRSPLWKEFKESRLGLQLIQQKSELDKQWYKHMGRQFDLMEVVGFVEKNSILAFYAQQGRLDFLLLSEMGTLARINLTSESTKKNLSSWYGYTMEKYNGTELITLEMDGWKFSYGIVDRAGMLSNDKALLKKAIDVYKGNRQGLTASSGHNKLMAGMPESGISFYANVARIMDSNRFFDVMSLHSGAVTGDLVSYLKSVAEPVDECAGAGFLQDGNLVFDTRMLHPSLSFQQMGNTKTRFGSLAGGISAVPANCLFFSLYETLDAHIPPEILKTFVSLEPGAEMPILKNGAAAAILEPNVKELQLIPPMMAFLRVKDRTNAEAAMKILKNSMRIGRRKLEFTETEYENIPISYTRIPIGMGMSIDAGYAFIGDDLLVVATDTSALEMVVDVSIGKRQSLMDDESYASVLTPIAKDSDGRIFVNISAAAMMTKQAARLYSWRAKISGQQSAERISTMLYENAFILEAWRHMGTAFNSHGDMTNVKMILQ